MIDSFAIERLRPIGLTPALIQQLAATAADKEDTDTAIVLLRVVEVHREGLTLHDGMSEHPGRQLPALRNALAAQGEAIAVGDWVLATRNALGEWWAHDRVPPINQLARRLHDGRDKATRVVIVSNVDTALLVMGLDRDFSLRRLERFVALAQMAHVTPVVVLRKADLCADAPARAAEVRALLPTQAAVVAVNALSCDACTALAPWLQRGQTVVLLGSSGTGKSTLTNTLVGSDVAVTGANRSDDSRGRHTTTSRSLHRTAGGCRFRDCRHADEPGCAVRGTVSDERLNNYNKLLREARRDTLTALERKVQVQQWKARGRQARIRAEVKRG